MKKDSCLTFPTLTAPSITPCPACCVTGSHGHIALFKPPAADAGKIPSRVQAVKVAVDLELFWAAEAEVQNRVQAGWKRDLWNKSVWRERFTQQVWEQLGCMMSRREESDRRGHYNEVIRGTRQTGSRRVVSCQVIVFTSTIKSSTSTTHYSRLKQ